MSTIRVIYSEPPNFPATDQHPDAVRYVVGGHIVDAIGGQPTQEEIDAVLHPQVVEQPTITDILNALPQASKDAVAASVAARSTADTLLVSTQPAKSL